MTKAVRVLLEELETERRRLAREWSKVNAQSRRLDAVAKRLETAAAYADKRLRSAEEVYRQATRIAITRAVDFANLITAEEKREAKIMRKEAMRQAATRKRAT